MLGSRRIVVLNRRQQSGFHPSDIDGIIWWDSLQNTYTESEGSVLQSPGNPVGSWVDRVQGFRLNAPATSRRPILSTTQTLNGKSTLFLDGSDDCLVANDPAIMNWTQDWAFYLVCNFFSAQSNETYFSRSDGTTSAQYELRRGTGDIAYVANAGASFREIREDTSISFFNRWMVLGGQFAPTSLTYGFRVNTRSVETTGSWVQGVLNEQSAQRFALGARNSESPSLFGNQAYRHVIALPRLFSDNERDALEAWLLADSGISATFT